MNLDELLLAVVKAMADARRAAPAETASALQTVRGLVDRALRSIREQAQASMG